MWVMWALTGSIESKVSTDASAYAMVNKYKTSTHIKTDNSTGFGVAIFRCYYYMYIVPLI